MLLTWLVRLPAMKFTLSVRSFHVPETPSTWAWPPSLPSVPARKGVGERREVVDHDVDGVLQLEDLALDVDGDLLGQVALGHGRRDLGDVADLTGEVGGHVVHRVGEVLPRARDAFDLGLAAELAFRA